MRYDFELVGKIGSMALIRREDADIDYNIFSRLGSELKPGMIWVTSGAAEIGRLDYIKRTGHELTCDSVDAKTDYAAQGQSILMEQYRHFVRPEYSVRQVLVEHQHFNDRRSASTSASCFCARRSRAQFRSSTTTTRFPTRRTASGVSFPTCGASTARCTSVWITTRRRRSSRGW